MSKWDWVEWDLEHSLTQRMAQDIAEEEDQHFMWSILCGGEEGKLIGLFVALGPSAGVLMDAALDEREWVIE